MSCAYKLEVVHEPGSPLFLMLGKMFSLLASNPHQVYFWINILSAFASAGTILFLFWTITFFAGKIITRQNSISEQVKNYLVIGAGILGSLCFTFSDTFWFSAVESEVYALSSFFTAFVFWCILKWVEECNEKPNRADRWIILIGFLMGLSIGVHLLNLLTIPALTFVIYFKKFTVDPKGILLTSLIALFLLSFVLFGLIPETLNIIGWVDILAVNKFKWNFNTGALFSLILIFFTLGSAIWYFQRRKLYTIYIAFLTLFFILLGYSSYTMVILRAGANPPLNNSNPDNINSLFGYLNREQYEESPLVWGPDYTSEVIGIETGGMVYRKDQNHYEEKGPKLNYKFAPGSTHFFPRLWSKEHSRDYAVWLGISGTKIPDFGDNISFLFRYQLDYMYLRYFLWNFVGRQNDTPSSFPNPAKGNWISGIKFLDALHIGNQSRLPPSITQNKAYNRLYFLPLILGFLGIYIQLKEERQDFSILALLFLFTGLAIAVYLNMPPNQPRERDYAFVGSFYAFSIWIGLGVIPIYILISKWIKPKIITYGLTLLIILIVPFIMAFQEWDDHDRSNRTVVKDFAANYLNSCALNAILFTNGDNETYPLWYAQEVEGIRTDIRVINLNLFDADWCIDKAKLKVNQSSPLPISWNHEDYKDGVRDYLPVKKTGTSVSSELNNLLAFAKNPSPNALDEDGGNYFPSHQIKLFINPEEVLSTHTMDKSEKDKIVPVMEWEFKGQNISKGQLIILDILNQNHWKRPIYFCSTSGVESFLGLDNYLREDGITLRVVPLKKESEGIGRSAYPANRKVLYDNLMNKFVWGNVSGNIHLDDQTNSFADSFKDIFMDLASSLWDHHEVDSCLAVLDKESLVLPDDMPPLSNQLGEEEFRNQHKAYLYFLAGKPKKAVKILEKQLARISDEVHFLYSLGGNYQNSFTQCLQTAESLLTEMEKIAREQSPEILTKIANTRQKMIVN